MSLPKKNIKYDVEIINPPIIGNKYMEYGFERIKTLLSKTDEKTVYLPRSITFENIDTEIYNLINENKLNLVIDGKKVPTFYLENERWGEFSKTWKFMDDDKNVPTPYITIRRIEKTRGTRLGERFNIPQNRLFSYVDVPIIDEGEEINLRYKIPQPINIDLIYEISLFTKYRVDVNEYDKIMFKTFASRQEYISINGSYMPVLLEETSEPKSIENIDGDKFYISKYTFKTLGFIQDENDFKIVKTTRKPKFNINIDKK